MKWLNQSTLNMLLIIASCLFLLWMVMWSDDHGILRNAPSEQVGLLTVPPVMVADRLANTNGGK